MSLVGKAHCWRGVVSVQGPPVVVEQVVISSTTGISESVKSKHHCWYLRFLLQKQVASNICPVLFPVAGPLGSSEIETFRVSDYQH